MEFLEQVKSLAVRVEKSKDALQSEEATKMSLIVPFFQLLGYDVFNPLEFVPEFSITYGVKKEARVDYAIFKDGQPLILIEAKPSNEPLDMHDSQLFQYFSATPAKFAILTNGIIYKFYTDLESSNIMDKTPFLELDMLNLKDSAINEVKKFVKQDFDVDNIFSTASELKYSMKFKAIFANELADPSQDFVRHFLTFAHEGPKTQNVIERFKPTLKYALNNYISEMMNEKIKAVLNANEKEAIIDSSDEAITIPQKTNKIVTTDEELEAFYLVKNILKAIVSPELITFKDTESYMNVLYNNNIRNWICRFEFTSSKKYLTIPISEDKKTVEKISYDNIYDIDIYSDKLIKALKRYI